MDVFDLFAKITLDTAGYKQGLAEASGETSSFGSKLKAGFTAAAKVAATALGAAATAVVKVTKDSAAAFADYEQLFHGVVISFTNGLLRATSV